MVDVNRETARRYVEEAFMQNRDFEKYIAKEYIRHNHGKTEPGIQNLKDICTRYHESFTDWKLTIHDIICEQNKAVVHFTIMLTHSQPYRGFEPSGARIEAHGIDIFRIADGKIVEQWAEVDLYHLINQVKEHSGAC